MSRGAAGQRALTYMSIRDEISSRCNEGRLYCLVPALIGTPVVRTMFVSPEVNDVVFGPWNDKEIESRAGRLRADLDMFTSGMVISVGENPFKKKKTAYMSPLDPTINEVWQIRSRDPKPGIRVFGQFSERDVFVSLTWGCRANLGGPGSREWRDTRERCKAEWRKLFPAYNPHTGNDPDEYISNIILV